MMTKTRQQCIPQSEFQITHEQLDVYHHHYRCLTLLFTLHYSHHPFTLFPYDSGEGTSYKFQTYMSNKFYSQ